MRELLAEGSRVGKAVSIWVEIFNPSVGLFERLGFSRIQQDGFNYLLQHGPADLAPGQD
jgi:hypothetical protein